MSGRETEACTPREIPHLRPEELELPPPAGREPEPGSISSPFSLPHGIPYPTMFPFLAMRGELRLTLRGV